MKKQMLFALLALTASQAFAYKVTGEEAKSDAPESYYLAAPPRLQKHTDVDISGVIWPRLGERQLSPAERAERDRRLELLKQNAAK